MADDVLGNLEIDLSIDTSDLSEQLASAVSQAQEAGQQMVAAFNAAGMADMSAPITAFTEALAGAQASVEEFATALSSLNANGAGMAGLATATEQAGAAASEASAGIGELAGAVEGAGAAARETAPAMAELGNAEEVAGAKGAEAAESINVLEEGTGALAESLGKLTAGFIGFEAIKEFSTDALEAFSTTQRWETAMTLLTGSTESTEQALTSLKDTALDMAVPFDTLLSTFQKLAAQGMEFGEINTLMQSAQDAAVATGNSFDQVADALGRISITGMVSVRQLVQLGITWDQLAQSMGVSVSEAQALMARGGQTAIEDLAAVEEALNRFKGASQAATDDLQGRWQIFKNAFTEDMDAIGSALNKLGEIWGAVGNALAVATGNLSWFSTSMKASIPVMSDVQYAAQNLGAGYLVAGKNMGEMPAASNAITVAFQAQKQALADAQANLAAVTKALAEGTASQGQYQAAVAAVTAAQTAMTGGVAKLSDAMMFLKSAAEEALQDQVKAVEEDANALTNLELLADGVGAAWDKFNSALPGSKDQLDAINSLMKDEKAAMDGIYQSQIAQTAAGVAALADMINRLAVQQQIRQAILDTQTAEKQMQESASAQEKSVAAMLPDYGNLEQIMFQTGAAAGETADAMGYQVTQAKAITQAMQQLGFTGKNSLDGVNADLTVMGQEFTSGTASTEQLGIAWDKILSTFKNSLPALQAIQNSWQASTMTVQQQLTLQTDILNAQLKIAQATDMTGQSELGITQKLAQVQQQQALIQNQTMLLSNTYTGMLKAFSTAWDGVSKGIADAIVTGQSFGQAMQSVLTSLEKSVTELVTNYLMTQLKDALLSDGNALNVFTGLFNAAFGAGGSVSQGFASSAKASTDFATGMESDMSNLSGAVTQDGSLLKGEFQSLGQSVQNFSTTASTSTQQAAVSIAASTSAMVADFTLVAAAIGAIAGIIGDIEQAHTNSVLGEIETNTRHIDIMLNGVGAEAANTTIQQLPHLVDIWGAVAPLANMAVNITAINTDADGMLAALQAIASGGLTVAGGNGAPVQTADTSVVVALTDLGVNIIQELERNVGTITNDMDNNAMAIIAELGTLDKDLQGAISALDTSLQKTVGTVTTSVDVSVTPLTDISSTLTAIKADDDQIVALLTTMNTAITATSSAIQGLATAAGSVTSTTSTPAVATPLSMTSPANGLTLPSTTQLGSPISGPSGGQLAIDPNTGLVSFYGGILGPPTVGQPPPTGTGTSAAPAFPGADITSSNAAALSSGVLAINSLTGLLSSYGALFAGGATSAQFGMGYGTSAINPASFSAGGGGNTPYVLPSGMEYTFQAMNLPQFADAGLVSPTGIWGETSTTAPPGPVAGTPGYLMQQGDMAGALALAAAENDTTAGAGYLHSSAFTSVSTNFGVLPTINSGISGIAADVANIRQMASSNATKAPQYTINVTVSAGVVAGSNGMQQLGQMVGQQVVASLKQAGLKPM